MKRNLDLTSRRGFLKTAGALTAAGATGALGLASIPGRANAAPATFSHPGGLHNAGDINRAKVKVAAGEDPWRSGWNRLIANSHSQPSWTPRPQATVYRGGSDPQNYGILYNDIAAAYQNALRWHIQGVAAHGDCARDILNAWSSTLTSIKGNADRFLAVGIYGWQFANVGELMRGYPGFDLGRFQNMMRTVFYPMNDDFLYGGDDGVSHNGACITNYWANWDLCNMASVMAIGILCDDGPMFDRAVNYFRNGAGNGSIRNAVPFVYDSQGLAQWQESGRDQGHTMMGMGQMGAICEMAWNQGVDLYGADSNRFMKAAQYVAKYNLGEDVPFTKYTWGSGTNCAYNEQTTISSSSRGQLRPVWAMLDSHYRRRRNLSVPYIQRMAQAVHPEGGGGDYGSTSGGFDQLGFGTLMYSK
ncbi:alginate lyase family protein [Nonomuraea sp. NPDC050451]|uniref:alginate lyase family protein n=1 Tax=Nonomuraea sp. NPDC050451 TaxID=3364364 RepID=UPI00379D3E21